MKRSAESSSTKPFPPVYGECDIIMYALRYLINIHFSNGKEWTGMKNTLDISCGLRVIMTNY